MLICVVAWGSVPELCLVLNLLFWDILLISLSFFSKFKQSLSRKCFWEVPEVPPYRCIKASREARQSDWNNWKDFIWNSIKQSTSSLLPHQVFWFFTARCFSQVNDAISTGKKLHRSCSVGGWGWLHLSHGAVCLMQVCVWCNWPAL